MYWSSDHGLIIEGEFCIPALVWMRWIEQVGQRRAYFLARGKYKEAEAAAALAEEYKRRIERLTADVRLW